MGDAYQIEFDGTDRQEVAERIKTGIGDQLDDEEMVEAVGALIAARIHGADDDAAVVSAVGDRIVHHLVEGGHSEAIVQEVADIVMDELPFGGMLIKRAVRRIVKGLMGRSDRVVEGVGEVIVEKLIEGGHADDLVAETVVYVVQRAIAEGYADDLVDGTLDAGLDNLEAHDGIDPIAEAVEREFPADQQVSAD
ncbi:hypothetical protein ACOZ4N_19465 [Halorientalis pallida]|uniref:hypothetical protein n=1 Tax=Halorientalis pallida TaxID=2479928 RepID=UPI003C6F6E95